MDSMYHDGHRELQDQFDTRRLADRLTEKLAKPLLRLKEAAEHSGCIAEIVGCASARRLFAVSNENNNRCAEAHPTMSGLPNNFSRLHPFPDYSIRASSA
jgi:hypothetical protein